MSLDIKHVAISSTGKGVRKSRARTPAKRGAGSSEYADGNITPSQSQSSQSQSSQPQSSQSQPFAPTTPRLRLKLKPAHSTIKRRKSLTASSTPTPTPANSGVHVHHAVEPNSNPSSAAATSASNEYSAAIQYLRNISKQKTLKNLGVRKPSFTRSNTTHNSLGGGGGGGGGGTTPPFKMPSILPPSPVTYIERRTPQSTPIAPRSEPIEPIAHIEPIPEPIEPIPEPIQLITPLPVPLPVDLSRIITAEKKPHVVPNYAVDTVIPYSSLINGVKPSYRNYTHKYRRPTAGSTGNTPEVGSNVSNVSNVEAAPFQSRGVNFNTEQHQHQHRPKQNANQPNVFIRRLHKTIRRKYQVGKSLKTRKVRVLVKNSNTQKRNQLAQQSLNALRITDMRTYLISHNLIRADSAAPDHIIKQLFETTMLAGDVRNTNTGIFVHNALSDFQPTI